MPERSEDTCQPESVVILITVPPVEKSSAAPRIRSLESVVSAMREIVPEKPKPGDDTAERRGSPEPYPARCTFTGTALWRDRPVTGS
jgi:hypothetical protein